MKWNVVQFARDYRLRINPTRKWIQMECPYCGDGGLHGGFSMGGTSSRCFKCGDHKVDQTVAKLLFTSIREAREIIWSYSSNVTYARAISDEEVAASKVDLPGTEHMLNIHKKYLIKRGFDPEELTKIWDLRFSGPEDPYWAFRIIVPIFYEGNLVSFQGRDVTEKKEAIRYQGARISESVLHYKKLLYGIEKCRRGVAGVVEGIFDMYNMGPGVVCVFGTSMTPAQINKLSKLERVIFLFDPDDPLTWEKSKKYVLLLRAMGVKAERIRYDGGDPGSLSKDDVQYLRRYVGI